MGKYGRRLTYISVTLSFITRFTQRIFYPFQFFKYIHVFLEIKNYGIRACPSFLNFRLWRKTRRVCFKKICFRALIELQCTGFLYLWRENARKQIQIHAVERKQGFILLIRKIGVTTDRERKRERKRERTLNDNISKVKIYDMQPTEIFSLSDAVSFIKTDDGLMAKDPLSK